VRYWVKVEVSEVEQGTCIFTAVLLEALKYIDTSLLLFTRLHLARDGVAVKWTAGPEVRRSDTTP
jgi:hypothetical protein